MEFINQQDHHPNHDKNVPLSYLKVLSPGDVSVRYYNGEEKYRSTLWNKLKMFSSIPYSRSRESGLTAWPSCSATSGRPGPPGRSYL